MEKRVRQLLDDIQHKFCTEAKALDLWKKIYNSANYEEFTKLFCQILQGIIQENYNNPYVKTIIAAMGKFVAEVSSRETKGLASPENLLLRDVISNIIRDHTEENEHFKFNVCSFLSVTLQNMDKNVEVDESVIRIVQDSLLEKLEDPKPLIRQQAVSALASIQCPFKRDCPVVGSLITCLINPHPSVRREVVKNIALTGISFSHIYKRTRDTDASVRRAAFSRMADIDPTRHLRITQRQYILKSGILETNQCTKKLFSELLLAKWLTAYNGNYIEFLKGIKLDADENDIRDTEKLSGQIMEFFLKSQPLNKIIEILPLDEDKLIPESSLQTEVVLYWNIVLKYLRQSEDLEEYIEQLIPELIIFCGYIQRIIDEMFPRKLQESFEENLNFQHMLCHLFDIAESYDLSEEVGRKALDGLIRKCLRDHQWHHKLLNKLIQIGSKLAPKLELFTNEVYNIIFDIWQPFEENPNQTGYFREYEFKRAQLKVKLTRLENELSYAIASANYEMSRKVEMELNEYRAKLENLSKEGPPLEMIRKPTEDPAKLCWCLDLLCALLMVYANHEHLPSSLNMFKDDFLLPLIWDKRAEILTRALKCMGIYCIYDQETAKLYHHLGTFKIHINKYKSMKLYNKKVVMNSVSLTCDLLMIHGVDWLDNEEEIDIGMSAIEGEPSKNQKLSFDSFIHVLLRMLQDEKMFVCEYCAKSFTRKDNLKRHGDCRVSANICNQCEEVLDSKGALQRHLKKKHPAPKACKRQLENPVISIVKRAKLYQATGPSTTRWCQDCAQEILISQWAGHRRSLQHRTNTCVQQGEGVQLVKTSFKCRIATYRLSAKQDTTSLNKFLPHLHQRFVQLVGDMVKKFGPIKVGVELFARFLLQTKELEEVKSFNTKFLAVSDGADLEELFQQFSTILNKKCSEFQEKESADPIGSRNYIFLYLKHQITKVYGGPPERNVSQVEDYEMRDLSVTVFAKLMCCGLPISSMSTSKLILKWFRLSSKSSAAKALQHKIGMILGAYVNSGNDAKKNVIEAIVPVLTVIAKAPPWSSLSLIDIDLAVQFMAIISDSGNSKVFLHSQLARILLDEIDLGPAKNATIYFAKMLNLLNITLNQSSEIQDIIDKVEKIFEEKTLSKAVMQHLARFLKKLKNGNNTTAISTSMSFNSTKTSVNRAKPLHIKAKKLGSRIKDITEKDPEDNELPRTEVQANISHILPEQASANTSADQTKPLHIQTKKLSSGIKHIIQKDPKDNELPRTEVEANISDVLPEQITKPQQPAPDQNISSSGSDIIGTTHTPVPMFNKILRVNLVRLPIKISRDNTSSDSDSDTAPPPAKYRRIRTPKDKTNSSSDSDTNSPPKKRQRLITRKVEMPGSAPKNKTENYSKKILKEPLATLPINTKGLEETVASHPAPEADSVFFDKSSIQSPQGNNLEKTNSSKDSHVTSSKESALSKSEDVVPIAQENFVENEIFSSWSSVEEIEKNLETNKSCEEHVDSNAQQSLKHIESAEESIISNEEDEKNSHYFFSGMSNVSFCTEESTDDISANTKLDEKKTASALEEVDVPQPSPEAKIVFSDKSRALSSQDVQEKRSPRKQRLSQEKTVSTSSNHSILSKSEDVGSLVEENEVLSSWSSIEEVEKIAQQNLEEIETDKDKGGNNQVYCSFGMSNVLSRKEEIPPSTQDSSAKPILDNNKSASVDVPQPSPEAKIVFSDKSRAPSSQDFRDKRSPEKQRSPQEKTFSTFNKSSLSESEDVGPLAKENVVLSSWSSIEELEKISQSNLMEIEPSAESIVSISDNEDKEGNIQAYCSSGMSNESSRTEEIPTSTQASSAKLILDNNKTVSDSTRTLGSRQSTTTDDTSSLMSNSYQQDLESSISAASDDSDDRHSSPISIRRSLDRKASNRTKIRSRSSKTLFLDEIDAAASDTDENIDDDPHR